ncbi:MAG: DUF1569 domain-containing protein [Chitinophagaceae bacterium]
MEIKNLYDDSVKQEIIDRITKLTPASETKWGKMNVSQMLHHCQLPVLAAYGTIKPRGNFFLRLLGPMFKSVLYNENPYKQGLPTDKMYIITDEKDFEKEKTELLNLVEKFSESAVTKLPHPVFGKLSKEQWSKATWKHLDHHLKQFGV